MRVPPSEGLQNLLSMSHLGVQQSAALAFWLIAQAMSCKTRLAAQPHTKPDTPQQVLQTSPCAAGAKWPRINGANPSARRACVCGNTAFFRQTPESEF
jgi:hypothetical protein